MRKACLDLIVVDAYRRTGRRATYSAVAGIVGGMPVGVMSIYPKDKLHSWVVAVENHLPTGYETDKLSRATGKQERKSRSRPNELRTWLRSLGAASIPEHRSIGTALHATGGHVNAMFRWYGGMVQSGPGSEGDMSSAGRG